MSGKKNILVVVACLSLLMSGCASNFVRPAQNTLVLGQSNTEDVTKKVTGSPYRQSVIVNNEKLNLVRFDYIHNNVFYGSKIPRRTLTYSFFNDMLVGEEFNSTFENEQTEFDVKKVAEIHKGQTLDQVVAIMGKPTGKILYPWIADKQGSGIVYEYTYSRFAPIYSPTTSHRVLITLDQNKVVTSISYKLDGKEQIAS